MKNTWKKVGTLALACLLAVGTAGCATTGSSEELKKVDPSQKGTPEAFARMFMRGLDANEMPIGGFIGPTDYYTGNGYGLPSLITDKVFAFFEQVANSGHTLLAGIHGLVRILGSSNCFQQFLQGIFIQLAHGNSQLFKIDHICNLLYFFCPKSPLR